MARLHSRNGGAPSASGERKSDPFSRTVVGVWSLLEIGEEKLTDRWSSCNFVWPMADLCVAIGDVSSLAEDSFQGGRWRGRGVKWLVIIVASDFGEHFSLKFSSQKIIVFDARSYSFLRCRTRWEILKDCFHLFFNNTWHTVSFCSPPVSFYAQICWFSSFLVISFKKSLSSRLQIASLRRLTSTFLAYVWFWMRKQRPQEASPPYFI